MQKSPLGDSWYWQVDRNFYRQPLQCNNEEFGWGFGVHAFHEMVFPLPSSARSFRTWAGLDQSVGEGGCVRWQVSVRGSEEKTLHQSPVVRGTKQVFDSGRLQLPAPDDSDTNRELVLSVDPLLMGTPPGADPLDIRDSLNWLEPELDLDPDELARELARHSLSQIPALAGWDLETNTAETVSLDNRWNEFDRNDPRYRVLLGSRGRFLSLMNTVRIAEDDQWLVLAVCRPDDKAPPSTLHIEIDGAAIAELAIPATTDARGPSPLLVPVNDYRGRTVNVRLVQFPSPEATAPKSPQEAAAFCVDWRGIGTSAHRPGLLPLLAENPDFLTELTEGEGTAEWDANEPFSTKTSLKVSPPERGVSRLAGLRVPIRAYPRLGEYRYISFAWKKDGGKQLVLGLAHNGKLGGDNFGKQRPRVRIDPTRLRKNAPARRMLESSGRGLQYGYRYHRGQSDSEIGAAMMVERKLPDGWQRVERDVFSDFGEFTLTGFSFLPFDGTAAWFDEIYLARDRADFQYLPSRRGEQKPSNDPNILLTETDPERLGLVTRTVTPAFAVTNSSYGVRLLKEYQGKTNVLQTMPRDQKTPCVLRAPVVL
ncbi:MAG: NPCBM/NEW2 domain-containing protein, partial [Planctomycetaceae bacterium]|nr:NPCBM/NEW2 domain-containing protein [Planctomycetaceae bacterium]